MSAFHTSLLTLLFSSLASFAGALVPVSKPSLPSLPAPGIEPNRGQAKAGILFLSQADRIAVTAQSILYSPTRAVLSLAGSKADPAMSFSDPLPGVANYYNGPDTQKWVTGVPRYATAHLGGIYPGVDAEYSVAGGKLTLSLLFAPGVDPGTASFDIAQAVNMTIAVDGELYIRVGTGAIPMAFTAPIASVTKSPWPVHISAQFVVQSATRFGVAVTGRESTLPLQITMSLSADGTKSVDSPGTQSVVDSTGSAFYAAAIPDAAGKDAPFPQSGYDGCGVGADLLYACTDVAVYKYSAAGLLVFVTYLTGQDSENAAFLGIAPDGSVAVAGNTDSADFPVRAAPVQAKFGGPAATQDDAGLFRGGDFFATRLDSATGLLRSSTFLGGPNADIMGSASLGTDGSLYFLPMYVRPFSGAMPVTSGALLSACQGDPCQNGYVARLSPALDRLAFGTYLPGNVSADAQLFSDGSVYYAGTAAVGFPTTPSAYQATNAGGYDGIVARLDSTGTRLLFATYVGTALEDRITYIAVAPDGSVWGSRFSINEDWSESQSALIHLDATGSRVLAQLPVEDFVAGILVDPAGNLLALTWGPVDVSPGAFLTSRACSGIVYRRISPAGTQTFATYLPTDASFVGLSKDGRPILNTADGWFEIAEDQSMGPYAGCVVDTASFSDLGLISPGAMVSILGTGLGPAQGVPSQVTNGRVPTTLGGTEVLVNGELAPLLYSSATQVNVILPYSMPIGTKPVIQVVINGVATNQLAHEQVNLSSMSLLRQGSAAVALNQDGTLNSAGNPAQPGSVVTLFAIGGGPTSPASFAGEITPLELRKLVYTPQIDTQTVDTSLSLRVFLPLDTEFAGAAPGQVAGLTQINVKLPDVIPVLATYPKGTLPLWVVYGTPPLIQALGSAVTIAVAAQ